MSIFPNVNVELTTSEDNKAQEKIKPMGRSFVFDHITKQFVFENGRNKETTDKQALQQWIRLILQTYKDKFKVYKDTSFYCNLEDNKGLRKTDFRLATIEREIKESLLTSRFIERVENFIFKVEFTNVYIDFDVVLKDGTILKTSEVIN